MGYELVFSDQFNKPGECPGPVVLYLPFIAQAYPNLEWYDPQQITTRDGALVIIMDSTATTQAGLTPGMVSRLCQTIRSLTSRLLSCAGVSQRNVADVEQVLFHERVYQRPGKYFILFLLSLFIILLSIL